MPDFAKSIRQLRPLSSKAQPQRHLFQAEPSAISLSHQLQYLKTRHPVSPPDPGSFESCRLPEGKEDVTPYGRHYIVRETFDDQHCHGKVRLGRFSCDELRPLMAGMARKTWVS